MISGCIRESRYSFEMCWPCLPILIYSYMLRFCPIMPDIMEIQGRNTHGLPRTRVFERGSIWLRQELFWSERVQTRPLRTAGNETIMRRQFVDFVVLWRTFRVWHSFSVIPGASSLCNLQGLIWSYRRRRGLERRPFANAFLPSWIENWDGGRFGHLCHAWQCGKGWEHRQTHYALGLRSIAYFAGAL